MTQREERRRPDRRSFPVPGDRRSRSAPGQALDWSEPLDWSDGEAPDESGRVEENGTE